MYDLDLEEILEESYALDCDSHNGTDDLVTSSDSNPIWRLGSILLFAYTVEVAYVALGYKMMSVMGAQDYKEYLSHYGLSSSSKIVDTESVWDEISSNPDAYSTQTILEKLHLDVMEHLEYDQSLTTTGLEGAINGSGVCFDYSGMLYSSFVKLVSDHPELADRLNDVRWTMGTAGEEHIRHAWIRVWDESGHWQNFETTTDVIRPGQDPSDVTLSPGYAIDNDDNYVPIVQFSVNGDGEIIEEFNAKAILKPATGPMEDLINMIELKTGYNIDNNLEDVVPETIVAHLALEYGADLFTRKKK